MATKPERTTTERLLGYLSDLVSNSVLSIEQLRNLAGRPLENPISADDAAVSSTAAIHRDGLATFFDTPSELHAGLIEEWATRSISHEQSRRDSTRGEFDPSRAQRDLRFVFSNAAVLAVNAALMTGRPLLVRGAYGSGKTSFARAVADVLGFSLRAIDLRSNTNVQDLLYRFDHVRRLADAQASMSHDADNYILLGPIGAALHDAHDTVVLLEDVDLTSPAFQTDLLSLAQQQSFTVAETSRVYSSQSRRLFILTSEERGPVDRALLTRCIAFTIERPSHAELVEIGHIHYPHVARADLRSVIERVLACARGRGPAVGAFLEALGAAISLGLRADDPGWSIIQNIVAASETGSDDNHPRPTSSPPPRRSPSEPSDVFISYAREDRQYATHLAGLLTAQGYRVFWDRQLTGGTRFAQAIEAALESTRCVLVLWSRASIESDWVPNEANVGAERDVLVPARLEDVRPPLPFRGYHSVDLMEWKATGDAQILEELLRAIKAKLAG